MQLLVSCKKRGYFHIPKMPEKINLFFKMEMTHLLIKNPDCILKFIVLFKNYSINHAIIMPLVTNGKACYNFCLSFWIPFNMID
jgi:hypothetical protein